MSREFAATQEQMREREGRSFLNRYFRLLLLAAVRAPNHDPEVDSIDALLEDDKAEKVGDVALRVQVIGDPTRPFGARDRIIQFFVIEGARDRIRRNEQVTGIIYELDDEGEAGVPLYRLSPAEVHLTISGEGFAATIPHGVDDPEPADLEPLAAPIPPSEGGEENPPPVATGSASVTSSNVDDLPKAPDADADGTPARKTTAKRTTRKSSKKGK